MWKRRQEGYGRRVCRAHEPHVAVELLKHIEELNSFLVLRHEFLSDL